MDLGDKVKIGLIVATALLGASGHIGPLQTVGGAGELSIIQGFGTG